MIFTYNIFSVKNGSVGITGAEGAKQWEGPVSALFNDLPGLRPVLICSEPGAGK